MIFIFYSYFYFLGIKGKKNVLISVLLTCLIIPTLSLLNMQNNEEPMILLFMLASFLALNKFNFRLDLSEYLKAITSGIASYIIAKIAILATETIILNIYKFSGTGILSNGEFTWMTTFLCILLMIFIGGFLVYLCKLIVIFINNKYGSRIRNYYFLYILLIFLAVSIYVVEEAFKTADLSFRFIGIVLLFISIMVIIALFISATFISTSIRRQKLKSDEQNYKNLELYMNNLEQNYSEIRKFRHDIKNVLLSLNIQIREFGDEKLIQNTDEILKEYNFDAVGSDQLTGFQHIHNSFIKGLLYSKFLEAKNLGVEFKLEAPEDVLNDDSSYFNEFRILGILLDNAIEASIGLESPKMTVVVDRNGEFVNFVIINNLPDNKNIEFSKIYSEGYSSKGKGRGLGLSTAKEIITSNDNVFWSLKVEDDRFIASLSFSEEK